MSARAAGVLLAVALLLGPAVAARADPTAALQLSVDRVRIETKLGDKFSFRSTIANRGASPATGLVVHLNVLSLRPGTYVDPEDWASSRTRYLPPIAAGGAVTITWRVQAVNDGDFGLYVAVLSRRAETLPPRTAPAIHLVVAQRDTLDSGGILPLAVGVPALVGLTALAVRLRRRR